MNTQKYIIEIAAEKYKDAECLFEQCRWDSCYYIGGYVVELLLKARICKTLGIEDFFDFQNPNKTKLVSKDGSLYRPFKVHDLNQLVILSGVCKEFNYKLLSNKKFNDAWSCISEWNEHSRYLTGKTKKEIKNLLISIQIFQQWILTCL